MADRITKSIAYAYGSSTNADALGFAEGCWHVSQTRWNIEGSDQSRTYLPHDAEGFDRPDHPDLIEVFAEYEGETCPMFLRYGNKDALAAIGF